MSEAASSRCDAEAYRNGLIEKRLRVQRQVYEAAKSRDGSAPFGGAALATAFVCNDLGPEQILGAAFGAHLKAGVRAIERALDQLFTRTDDAPIDAQQFEPRPWFAPIGLVSRCHPRHGHTFRAEDSSWWGVCSRGRSPSSNDAHTRYSASRSRRTRHARLQPSLGRTRGSGCR